MVVVSSFIVALLLDSDQRNDCGCLLLVLLKVKVEYFHNTVQKMAAQYHSLKLADYYIQQTASKLFTISGF